MGTFALNTTKWLLDVATRLVRANVRLHGIDRLRGDMAVIFVVNHFTRLETLLLPYLLNRHARLQVHSLAAGEFFKGPLGRFLLATGNVSTKDPDRDTIIIRSLLDGEHPWIVFPEGGLVKDKKLVDRRGMFSVWSHGKRRPPHKGPAVLALRTEFYRHKLACICRNPEQRAHVGEVLVRFGIDSAQPVLSRRTVIVPVNITYFPIRAHDNVFLRAAQAAKKNLSLKAVEELAIEGTVLAEDTDIDITFGEPIDVREYLGLPEHEGLMACGPDDFNDLERDPRSLFNGAARKLMLRYMKAIYQLTTVNSDHLLATLVHSQRQRRCAETVYRQRFYLAAECAKRAGTPRVHPALESIQDTVLLDEESPRFDGTMGLFGDEGIIRREGDEYLRSSCTLFGHAGREIAAVRRHTLSRVMTNEIEPLSGLTAAVRHVAVLPEENLARRIRAAFVARDRDLFEGDYAAHANLGESKPPEVGRPFLLVPERVKGGVVLVHGYMAAPLEVRALAEFLFRRGFAVYGVRLKGHGTAPEDLAASTWEDWYASLNRGYVIMKTLSRHVVVGGFSTGGTLSLLAAARKRNHIQGAFSINAPLRLLDYRTRLASSIVTMNQFLSTFHLDWNYVPNNPENPHINYSRNPIRGVRELNELMRITEEELGRIEAPLLIAQARGDDTVDPTSAHLIVEKATAAETEMAWFDRNTHGIVNGAGSEEVFERICAFLLELRRNERPGRSRDL